jgi:hypothetical protein
MSTSFIKAATSGFLLFIAFSFAVNKAAAQRRDYLTPDEVELVRDAQEIDLRVSVLTTAIDRRFEAMKISLPTIPGKKLDEKWGPAPTGSRLELLADVKGLLQKAVDDIDDVAEHKPRVPEDGPVSEKQKKKDAERFPNAVRQLASSAERYRTALKATGENTNDPHERGVIMDSIDLCDQIIEAAGTLPKT